MGELAVRLVMGTIILVWGMGTSQVGFAKPPISDIQQVRLEALALLMVRLLPKVQNCLYAAPAPRSLQSVPRVGQR